MEIRYCESCGDVDPILLNEGGIKLWVCPDCGREYLDENM